jgi:pimeloyl-ACP methyl ester carboxylesterase
MMGLQHALDSDTLNGSLKKEFEQEMTSLDDSVVSAVVFHPRSEPPGYRAQGTLTRTACPGAEVCGYLHSNKSSDTLLLFFHGNGEIAADYDALAGIYTNCGVSLWVVDYRGYGQSTGSPAYSHIYEDAQALFKDIPKLGESLDTHFRRVLVMGRSLGSASAIHLAATYPNEMHGLVLDSPFADAFALIHRVGGPLLSRGDHPEFTDNIDLIPRCIVPTLFIHGTDDMIIPISDSELLYDACGSKIKRMVRIKGAGHNDLLFRGFEQYCTELREHIIRIG